MTFEQLLQLAGTVIGPLVGAVGAYVAIRSDLAAIRARIEGHGESITRAHERIDQILTRGNP